MTLPTVSSHSARVMACARALVLACGVPLRRTRSDAHSMRHYSTSDGDHGEPKRASDISGALRVEDAADAAKATELKLGLFYNERIFFPSDRVVEFRFVDEASKRMILHANATTKLFGHVGGMRIDAVTTRETERKGIRAVGRIVSPDVGCMMRIWNCHREPSGPIAVMCSALQRVRLVNAEWVAEGRYRRSSVTTIDDEPMEDEDELRAQDSFEQLRQRVSAWKASQEGTFLRDDVRRNMIWLLGARPGIAGMDWPTFSFTVAEIVSSLRRNQVHPDRQYERLVAMLATTDTAERLRLTVEHMLMD